MHVSYGSTLSAERRSSGNLHDHHHDMPHQTHAGRHCRRPSGFSNVSSRSRNVDMCTHKLPNYYLTPPALSFFFIL